MNLEAAYQMMGAFKVTEIVESFDEQIKALEL